MLQNLIGIQGEFIVERVIGVIQKITYEETSDDDEGEVWDAFIPVFLECFLQ